MAQSSSSKKNKSSASASKSTAKSSSAKRVERAVPPSPSPTPHRREIGAFVFLFAAVFLIISYFNSDGAVIVFVTDLFKGLIGWGFWLTAPAFFVIACILGFHRGRPVAFRVFCMLMLPILFAAMGHLLYADLEDGVFELTKVVGQLFTDGQILRSGGVVGGLIAIGLKMAFSVYGAFPLLLVLFAVLLILGLRLNLSSMAGKLKERASIPYDPADYPQPEEKPVAPIAAPKMPKARPAAEKRAAANRRPYFDTDLPLGEDEEHLPLHQLEDPDEEELFQQRRENNPRRAKVRKKNSAAEAAEIAKAAPQPEKPEPAGIEVGDGFLEYPLSEAGGKKPVVPMVGGISDPPKPKKPSPRELEEEVKAVAGAIDAADASGETADYVFPPLTLLRSSTAANLDYRDEVRLNRDRLENALHSFGISSAIAGVIRGPTVTRYDIELEQGVKLSRVTNLAGDLALALGVVNVRIAPIPDKISTVGIEVPNKLVSTVLLRDILESPKFSGAKSKLSFALGKDIGGDCIVGNISKLPHLLIAGTTGSGKSVCMNSLILSLLFKARPDEVRLIMIDPKMVELGIYNGIPHLYVPVVTDPKKAAGALQWSVVEMLKRYRLFSELGVRDLENYNRLCEQNGEQKLPQVVIVIDELADLMMIASKEVEESICRVAQMGRAAGMHLVIATQRPSADVITGLMKANIPSRIAFAVSSAMESRIILDQSGAEKLVGMGDMLFAPLGTGKPTRIQGAFVSDEERESVVQFIKDSADSTQSSTEIEEFMNKAAEEKSTADKGKGSDEGNAVGDYDEMLPQAVEAVLEMKSCSVSMLQRRVKLGYSRAARIVDQMEELGIVGPYEGAKPRSVLVDRSGWHAIQVQLGLAADGDLELAREMNESDEDDLNY